MSPTSPMRPRYPHLRVALETDHPLALVSATRLALRQAGATPGTIEEFTRDALASDDPGALCARWVEVETTPSG